MADFFFFPVSSPAVCCIYGGLEWREERTDVYLASKEIRGRFSAMSWSPFPFWETKRRSLTHVNSLSTIPPWKKNDNAFSTFHHSFWRLHGFHRDCTVTGSCRVPVSTSVKHLSKHILSLGPDLLQRECGDMAGLCSFGFCVFLRKTIQWKSENHHRSPRSSWWFGLSWWLRLILQAFPWWLRMMVGAILFGLTFLNASMNLAFDLNCCGGNCTETKRIRGSGTEASMIISGSLFGRICCITPRHLAIYHWAKQLQWRLATEDLLSGMPLAHLKSSIQEKTVFARTKSSMISNESDQSATKPLPNRTCSKIHKIAVEEVRLQKATYDSTTLPLFSNIFGQNRNLLWRFLLGTGVQPGDFHVEINHAELSFLILVWFFVSNDLAILELTCGKRMDGPWTANSVNLRGPT